MVMVVVTGIINGRKDRECGAIGVTQMHWVFAWTMEPPAERLYAVDPVGVDRIMPSPTSTVIMMPSKYISS